MTREILQEDSLTVVRVLGKCGDTRLIESAWGEDGEKLATRALESPVFLSIGEILLVNEVPRSDVPGDNLFSLPTCGIAAPDDFELRELASVLGPDLL